MKNGALVKEKLQTYMHYTMLWSYLVPGLFGGKTPGSSCPEAADPLREARDEDLGGAEKRVLMVEGSVAQSKQIYETTVKISLNPCEMRMIKVRNSIMFQRMVRNYILAYFKNTIKVHTG